MTRISPKISRLTLIFAAFLLVVSQPIFAEESLKIGMVRIPVLLKKSPQSKLARDKIEAEFAPRESKIIAKQEKAKALNERVSKDADVMSKAERKKIERQIINLNRDIKRAKEEFTEDLNIRRNEEVRKLQRIILEAVKSVAKEQNYDLILDESVVYFSPRVNLTKQVLKKLQSEIKSGAQKK